MKTKLILPLLALLVCSCGPTSKEIEVKEKVVVNLPESDGLYEPYSRGAELFSLIPETVVLSWGKDSEQKSGFKQLNVTVKIRLDQVPDTTKYVAGEDYNALTLYLSDINGQYFGDGQFDSGTIPLPLFPGLSLVDSNTEKAKIRDLLASKPGTVAEVTFVGIVQDRYIKALADHITSCVADCTYPLYDKNPRHH